MLAPWQEDRGTEGQIDGLTDVNVPATPHRMPAAFIPFCLSSQRQKRPLKLRTAGCSLKPQSARQRGSFGVCRRSWSRRSRCRRQLDSREWAHCAGIVCVCVCWCGAAGDFSTCRIVRSDKEPKCQYTWQRRCRNSS